MVDDNQIRTIVRSICSRGNSRQDIPTVLAMIIEYGLDIELQDKVIFVSSLSNCFFLIRMEILPS